jgi:hypothetical protein
MSSHSSRTTTNLNEIKRWTEERGGKPVRVKGTENDGGGAGVLRIDFPGYSGADSLEEISWDEWYDTFKEKNLEFLYQDELSSGKESRFFKLINKDDNERS